MRKKQESNYCFLENIIMREGSSSMSLKNAETVVLKIGTSSLTYENGRINLRKMSRLVKVAADIANSGRKVVLVSSGSVGVGAGKLGIPTPGTIKVKQAAAAVGQCELMFMYDKMFSEYSHTVAQVLLTRTIIEKEDRMQNVINTFHMLTDMGVIPIVNENDTVAVDELEFGDNDTLSAIVSVLVQADALIILTDIDGLYDSDPRKNPDAKLIPEVDAITPEIEALAGGSGSPRGTGGMVTKLSAAKIATGAGVEMAIIRGDAPELIYDLLEGKSVGTVFHAKGADET